MAKKTEEAPAPAPVEKKISKTEAVRQTLAAGIEMPKEAVNYVREKFGLELTPQMFSSYKTQINKKKGTVPGKRGRKAGSANSKETPAVVASVSHSSDHGVVLAREVKALVEKFGATAVKGMADVFAN